MNENHQFKKKNSQELTDKERKQMAEYAVRHYFSDANKTAPWYREGVTEENVLEEIEKPSSPISSYALAELWRESSTLQRSFQRQKPEPSQQLVEDYLNREKGEPKRLSYENWEVTINSLRSQFGNITRAMIGKIALKALDKAKYLLGGVNIIEMSPEEEIVLMEKIQNGKVSAARWYAATLWDYAGKIGHFLKLLRKMKIISKTEFELITEDEFQTLSVLAYLKPEEIQAFLLDDIEDDNNILKTYQNTVSRRLYAGMKQHLEDEVD